ncbi:U3 small nucleolar RNA-associated protein 14 homolog C-like isoform X2 [Acanthaster planci]|uniref:U3 small nucleolar RNA-associated protein 14 homolog C-like isoform X2 n=1 Tax=Acanthaster planci TaxID=133434 RepID=A0A8B7XNV9_ACAPL|nr:U3 small nucleolar RNA-associated protein 14 homolog C-like isoform X2 [Acanthaster planci]
MMCRHAGIFCFHHTKTFNHIQVQRSVAYEAAANEVSKWDQVVQANRRAEHMSFPLNQPRLGLQTTDQFVKKFQPSSPLEQEVYKILHGSKHSERPNKLALAEEEILTCMSLEEAQERRAELQKTRALLSYYEAKCHRKKKIKSKMYHRIERKCRTKEAGCKFRQSVKAGTDEAKELLDKFERARAKERVTLKHRNTGKWAKGLMRFGKYDSNARHLLAKQLQQSYDLTTKFKDADDGDIVDNERTTSHVSQSDGSADSPTSRLLHGDINNPWFTGTTAKHQETVHTKSVPFQPVSSYVMHTESDNESCTSDNGVGELREENKCNVFTTLTKSNLKQEDESKSDHDKQSDGDAPLSRSSENLSPLDRGYENTFVEKQKQNAKLTILRAEATAVQSSAPDLIIGEEQSHPFLTIREAFAEDDIVEAFQDEKQEHMDLCKPSDDGNLSLAGWGDWGSAGVRKRKMKRFVTKAKPAQPQRVENLQHALVNESRNKKMAVHQVNHLPFPYSAPEQFQRSVRVPIGSTWNTPSVFKKITTANVTTKMGTVIEPIDASETFKKTKKRTSEPLATTQNAKKKTIKWNKERK